MGERIGMDIVKMVEDRCANAVTAPDYENCKMDCLQTLAMEPPFTEEEFRNEKKEALLDKTFNAAMELFKRKTDRMAQVAYPVIKQVYENQGAFYQNILIPITDGKRVYNISCNLKAAYESECKEVVKSFEKAILLHVIDEAWKENLRELDELKHSERQLRTERPVAHLQTGVGQPVRRHGGQDKQPDHLHPDARTDTGARTPGGAPGRSRAASGHEQIPGAEAGPERPEPTGRRRTRHAREAQTRAHPRAENRGTQRPLPLRKRKEV